jgi:serine/threonine protein kinase
MTLGEGGFGTVTKVYDKEKKLFYAQKTFCF